MFRNNRLARILFPLIIIAILVVTMELLDRSKRVDDKTTTRQITYSVNPNQELKAPEKNKGLKNACMVEVECITILKNMDKLKKELRKQVPKNGYILKATKVKLQKMIMRILFWSARLRRKRYRWNLPRVLAESMFKESIISTKKIVEPHLVGITM